jgi:Glycosyl transferases group 1
MVLVSSANPSMQLIAASRPAHWTLQNWQAPIPSSDLVVLCEENTFPSLPPHAVAIVLDSVRYPPGFLKSLPNRIITLDAPAEGCHFRWTPVRAELFAPKKWDEREGVICPVRLKNYPMRQKAVERLQKIGVKILERDDQKRSYPEYVDELCRAWAVVNFNQDRKTGKPQVKGRVFEALHAGALLIEESNKYMREWWAPSAVYWESLDELKKTVEWLEEKPRRARSIADAGLLQSKKFFSAARFWANVETIAHE